MLLFDMDMNIVRATNEMSLRVAKTKHITQTMKFVFANFTIYIFRSVHNGSACVSIFFTNAHKLVFRFLSPKNAQRRQSIPRHVLKIEGTFFRLFYSLRSYFFLFFAPRLLFGFFWMVFSVAIQCLGVFVVIVVVDVITTADYVWVLWMHLVNSLIFHLPFAYLIR